jgi:host factor-I protein
MEQEEITIYITNAKLEGIVSVIHPEAVELRQPDGKRCVIAVDKIEAVSIF